MDSAFLVLVLSLMFNNLFISIVKLIFHKMKVVQTMDIHPLFIL